MVGNDGNELQLHHLSLFLLLLQVGYSFRFLLICFFLLFSAPAGVVRLGCLTFIPFEKADAMFHLSRWRQCVFFLRKARKGIGEKREIPSVAYT